MKKMLVSLLLLLSAAAVNAETFATQPNKAGGKIVLTDEPCTNNNQNFDGLYRVYNYSSEGYTGEGCWAVDGETIMVVWADTAKRMRYPFENFTVNPEWKLKKNDRKYKY